MAGPALPRKRESIIHEVVVVECPYCHEKSSPLAREEVMRWVESHEIKAHEWPLFIEAMKNAGHEVTIRQWDNGDHAMSGQAECSCGWRGKSNYHAYHCEEEADAHLLRKAKNVGVTRPRGESRKLKPGDVLHGDFVKRDGTHSDTYTVGEKE